MGPYGTARDRTGPYGAVQDRTGPYGTIRGRTELYGTVRDRTGLYGAVRGAFLKAGVEQDRVALSKVLFDDTKCFVCATV